MAALQLKWNMTSSIINIFFYVTKWWLCSLLWKWVNESCFLPPGRKQSNYLICVFDACHNSHNNANVRAGRFSRCFFLKTFQIFKSYVHILINTMLFTRGRECLCYLSKFPLKIKPGKHFLKGSSFFADLKSHVSSFLHLIQFYWKMIDLKINKCLLYDNIYEGMCVFLTRQTKYIYLNLRITFSIAVSKRTEIRSICLT